jgi:hypothetical protein
MFGPDQPVILHLIEVPNRRPWPRSRASRWNWRTAPFRC